MARRERKARRLMLTVPPLRPAALEPAWLGGRLVLPPSPQGQSGDFVVLSAALSLVRGEIRALALDAERNGSIDARTIASLRDVAARIPSFVPAQSEFFFLAHVKGFLQASSGAIHGSWPRLLAKRYDEVTRHFDQTLQQFPKWREFLGAAEKDPLAPCELAGLSSLTNLVVTALRADEARMLIDPQIPAALEAFHAPLQCAAERTDQQPLFDQAKLLLAIDLYSSIENVAKRTAEAALHGDSLKSAAPGGLVEPPAREDKDSGIALGWITRTLAGMAGAMPASALRARFVWLEPIVAALGGL